MNEDPAMGRPPQLSEEPDRAATASAATERPPAVDGDRSPNAWVCPFLRASDQDELLVLPIESPDPANRCVALHDPVPQSLRQQELVCLKSGHVNCPRYLRGSIGVGGPLGRVTATRAVTPATAGAVAVFVLAFLISVGFVVGNGGLVLTAAPAGPPSGGVLGEVETPAPTVAATAIPTAAPTVAPTPTPTPIPTPRRAPPRPRRQRRRRRRVRRPPRPPPRPRPPPKPASNRFALLTPCPNTSNCYVYAIRSGDNLFSIAKYFGVSLKRIQTMNPWVSSGLTVGRGLRIPTPTR